MVLFKKVGNLSLILIMTSTFEAHLSMSESWCLFGVFTQYLSEFFVFHMKKLISFNLFI